jgi:DNA-binding MarR family transcriptional regulator
MSFAHLGILYVLDKEPGVTGAEIARRGSVTAQTMNGLLRRLEEDGLIERQPHPNSARSDSWFVTAAGHKSCRAASTTAMKCSNGCSPRSARRRKRSCRTI